jgi:copper chaperone CopZ
MVSVTIILVIELKIELNIKSMTCKSCEKIIERELFDIEGIKSVKANFLDEKLKVNFDNKIISKKEIINYLDELGYPLNGAKKSSLKEGLIYGLVPHIGCIGFIVASILGVTIAVEFFKPLLMNPWFFHILIVISFVFATVSSVIYLKNNGALSMKGIKKKKGYLATMYGATIGINLILFLFIFPMLANLDTGSFATGNNLASSPGGAGNLELDSFESSEKIIVLSVEIPCPGHASLITNEIKTIDSVTGVRFNFPNLFDVAFTGSAEEILALEVFDTYPATLVEGESNETIGLSNNESVEQNVSESTPTSQPGLSKITKSAVEPSGESSESCTGCGSCGGGCGSPSCTN